MRFSSTYTGQNNGTRCFLYVKENHLGNVLTTISDRKIAVDDNNDGTVDYFLPDILSANDYFVFGSPIPGRHFNSGDYRYGAFGFEKDDEVKGNGNQLWIC
jgi:hypothetical protein